MDGEANQVVLEMRKEALAPVIHSFGKRLKVYTLLKRETAAVSY